MLDVGRTTLGMYSFILYDAAGSCEHQLKSYIRLSMPCARHQLNGQDDYVQEIPRCPEGVRVYSFFALILCCAFLLDTFVSRDERLDLKKLSATPVTNPCHNAMSSFPANRKPHDISGLHVRLGQNVDGLSRRSSAK